MSLTEILEQRPPGAAVRDANGLTYPRKWSVIARSERDAESKLRAKRNIGLYLPYVDGAGNRPDPQILCQRLTIEGKPPAVDGGMGQYIITAEYNSSQTTIKVAQPGGSTVWSVRPTIASSVVDHDVDGYPLLFSADEPIDPPMTKLKPEEVLHGEFYVQGDDEIAAYAPFRPHNGKLNLTTYMGAPKGCLLLHVFTPTPSDTGWIKMAIDIQYKPPKILFGKQYEGWADTVPDMGRRTITDGNYTTITAPDDQGNEVPVAEPVLLDGFGQRLAAGGNPVIRAIGNNPAIHHYFYVDFNTIIGLKR